MLKIVKGAAALTILSLAATTAHATTGAVEPAPVADPEAAVERRDLTSLSGFYLSALSAASQNDLDAAAGFFTAALQKDPDNAALLDRSLLLSAASGDIARAAELAKPLVDGDASGQAQILALLTLAITEARAGEFDNAIGHLQALRALGGPLPGLIASLLEGWAVAGKGEPARAIKLLDDIEGPNWVDPFKRLHAGLVADSSGLFAIAEDRLRLAYELDAGDPRVAGAYSRSLARSGETERAEAVLNAFARAVAPTGRLIESMRADIAADAVAPLVADAHAGMGEALYGLGRGLGNNDRMTAASLLQLSLYVSPASDFPALALGGLLEGMRQHEDAIATYRMVPADAPLHREALLQEALNLNALKRHEEAVASLAQLVNEDPKDTAVSIALGNVHRSLEQFNEAAEAYSHAIAQFDEVPDTYWTLYYFRGIAYERTKRWPLAEKDFRKALELSPDHPLVLNYLGYSYIDRGDNLDEALEMVRLAVEKEPEDGYIVDSLGWAYYRLGRFDEAVRELERAVALRPADPVINDHLGDAYWRVGRKLEAMFQWSHAKDLDPEPDDLKKIETKLEKGLDAVEEPSQVVADGEGPEGTTSDADNESQNIAQ